MAEPAQPWSVIWQPDALQEVRRLDRRNRERISRAVERLATEGHGNVTR